MGAAMFLDVEQTTSGRIPPVGSAAVRRAERPELLATVAPLGETESSAG